MSKYPKDGAVYIEHILSEIADIEKFTANGERDDKTYRAILSCLVVIGEATYKMPDEFKVQYSDITWHEFVGMRNSLAHDYLGTRAKTIWDTVEHDIPHLKSQLLELQERLK